jgi:nitric oxide reductase subunit B
MYPEGPGIFPRPRGACQGEAAGRIDKSQGAAAPRFPESPPWARSSGPGTWEQRSCTTPSALVDTGIILLVSFGILGFMGTEIYRAMPPVPDAYVSVDGEVIYTRDDIERGRQVWQTTGGHQQGSIWGHGAYVAPDWTADWLHREAVALLDIWAQRDFGVRFGGLSEGQRAVLEQRLRRELRTNTYDPDTDRVTVSAERAEAIRTVAAHYDGLFGNDPELAGLREAYAMMQFPVPDAERRQLLGAFFFWSSWAAATNRPGDDITYTNNWPHEQLIDNTPTGAAFMWTFVSILVLLAGVGALAWHYA